MIARTGVVFSIFFVISAWATGARSAEDSIASGSASAVKPTPSAQTLASYENAKMRRIQAEQDLSLVRDLFQDASSLRWAAKAQADEFRSADNGAQHRRQLIEELSRLCGIAIQSSEAAISAITAYRNAADQAIRAIENFSEADPKSAERKASLADTAIDTKAKLWEEAETAVADAATAAETLRRLQSDINFADARVRRDLKNASDRGGQIAMDALKLQASIKKIKPGLAVVLGESLARVQDRAEHNIGQGAKLTASDAEIFRQFHLDLSALVTKSKERSDQIQAYFEAATHASVKREAHSYLKALNAAQKPNQRNRAELESFERMLASAFAAAAAAKKENEESHRAAWGLMVDVLNRTKPLPAELQGVANSLDESASLLAETERIEKDVLQVVRSHEAEYNAALEVEKRAFTLAYGHPPESPQPAPAAAAAGSSPAPAPAPAPTISVEQHVYARVYVLAREPRSFGAYTYVLFNEDIDKTQEHVRKRYTALLNAIDSSTSEANKFTAAIPKNRLNLFCIPSRRSGKQISYDSDLARSYLATAGSGAFLRPELMKQTRMSPGPFLLTTRSRLSAGKPDGRILFVDLSTYPAESFASLLAEYKNALIENPPTEQQIWTPPALQRVTYLAISTTTAVPKLTSHLKKLTDFFIPSAQAETK